MNDIERNSGQRPDTHRTPDEPRFDPDTGLVPAVVQDVRTGEVRMLGYMNRVALERTRETGRVTFWSRSRGELWEKGETSGNRLEAREIRLDCDGDAILVRALPLGPTCHTGLPSCFDARVLWEEEGEKEEGAGGAGAFDGDSAASLAGILAELARVIADRDRERPEGSYTAELLEGGPVAAARKVAEEGVEVALAAATEPGRLAAESADLVYHLLVLWRASGVDAEAVDRELRRRRESGPDPGDGSGRESEPSGTGWTES